MRKHIFLLLLILPIVAFAQNGNLVQFSVDPESKIWFTGTSTLHDYHCDALEFNGFWQVDPALLENDFAAESTPNMMSGQVTIPVEKLESGKGKMNNKMYETLKAEKHKNIVYTLNNIQATEKPDTSEAWMHFTSTGKLKVAGVENDIEMDLTAFRDDDGSIRFQGQKPLLMTNFDMKPPKMMFGALKTGDEVIVHFDLKVVKASN